MASLATYVNSFRLNLAALGQTERPSSPRVPGSPLPGYEDMTLAEMIAETENKGDVPTMIEGEVAYALDTLDEDEEEF